MRFDIVALTDRASFWDSVSVALAGAVALGVIMESVVDFKVLLRLSPAWLEKHPHAEDRVAKTGLLILILALVLEVIAALKSHAINEQIVAGLNAEIIQTQEREQALIRLTGDLGKAGHELEGKFASQEDLLKSLGQRSDDVEKSARALRDRTNASLVRLKADEQSLEAAQRAVVANAGKAANAAELANKAAADMTATVEAEKAMQEGMRELVTPRVLTPNELSMIKERLKPWPNTPFDLTVTDDPDANALVQQIGALLSDAGWTWKDSTFKSGFVLRIKDRPTIAVATVTDVHIEIAESAIPVLEKPTQALLGALRESGIKSSANGVRDSEMDAGTDRTVMHVVVGKR